MTELEMFEKISQLNGIADDLEHSNDWFKTLCSEAPILHGTRQDFIDPFDQKVFELKMIISQIVGFYLTKIIEARAT